MHPVERLALAPAEQARHRLVREDHHLLDERVRERLGLDPGPLDSTVAVELERRLPRFDPERPPRVALAPKLHRDALGEAKRLGRLLGRALVAGQDRLGARVGEALAASDHAAVEERLAGREAGVEEHLDGHAAAVLVGAQAAEVGREQLRKHRLDPARHVRGEGAVGRVLVEGRAGRDVGAHVGDVDPGANALPLAAEAQGVVEVLRLVGVDREREEVAQVGSVRLDLFGRRRNRRVRASHPLVPEQSLEHRADVSRAAEHRLDFRPSAPEAENDEVAARTHRRSPCGRP